MSWFFFLAYYALVVQLTEATLLLRTTVTYKQPLQANSSNQRGKKTEYLIAQVTHYIGLSVTSAKRTVQHLKKVDKYAIGKTNNSFNVCILMQV